MSLYRSVTLTALAAGLGATSLCAQGIGRLHPQHGGILFASDAVNAEFVLKPKGAYQVYFTDPTGEELPASVAADVALSLKRVSGATESIALHVDDSGEAWAGNGAPVDGPIASAHITYKYHGKPEQTDIPFANGYHAEFKTIPAQVKPGEETQLVVTIRDFFGRPIPKLQIEHTKPMHLMVVSRDLAEFDHIHPEPAPGSVFRVAHTFAHGGNFKLYVDYTPIGAANRIEPFELNVTGPARAAVPLVPTTVWTTTL